MLPMAYGELVGRVRRDLDRSSKDEKGVVSWDVAVRELVRDEMVERGITYKQLLAKLGPLPDDPEEMRQEVKLLTQRIRRGRFTGAFLLEVCVALELASVDLARTYQRRRLPQPRPWED